MQTCSPKTSRIIAFLEAGFIPYPAKSTKSFFETLRRVEVAWGRWRGGVRGRPLPQHARTPCRAARTLQGQWQHILKEHVPEGSGTDGLGSSLEPAASLGQTPLNLLPRLLHVWSLVRLLPADRGRLSLLQLPAFRCSSLLYVHCIAAPFPLQTYFF